MSAPDLFGILAGPGHGQGRPPANGPDAVRFAEEACRLTEQKFPGVLDALAAAYAEVGRFDDAVRTAGPG